MPAAKIFSANDEIMVFDKGKMYKSRILKVQVHDMNTNYFIHFDGWNRKFDSWVDSRLCCAIGSDEMLQNFIRSLTQPGTAGKDSEGKKIKKEKAGGGGVASNAAKEVTDVSPSSPAPASKASSAPSKQENSNNDNKVDESSNSAAGGGKKKRTFAEMSSKDKAQVKELLLDDLLEDESEDTINKIPIVVPLKRHLIEDWTCITKDPKKLLKLPKQTYTVERIVSDFLSEKQKQDKVRKDPGGELYPEYKELADGLLEYFNQALPRILLYRQEISQYEALLVGCKTNSGRAVTPRTSSSSSSSSSSSISNSNSNSNSSNDVFVPSKVYGAEHLLRLFVRMPKLMIGMAITKEEISQIIFRFTDLLKFIHKHMTTYLDLTEYVLVEEALALASCGGGGGKGLDSMMTM